MKRLDSGATVNLLNLVPVFGVAFAVLVLREPVSAGQLLGGLVVICGVALSFGIRKPREEKVRNISQGEGRA